MGHKAYRVVTGDEKLGITLLRMNFGPAGGRYAGNGLMVWEALKVYGGEIHGVARAPCIVFNAALHSSAVSGANCSRPVTSLYRAASRNRP
jgi:hypothetical protein